MRRSATTRTKLNWLGSAGSTTYVLLVHNRTGVQSGADLAGKSIRIGDQSPGGVGHRINLTLREGLGWQIGTPIFGYTGTREIALGIDRGEVDAMFLPWDSALQQKGDDLRSGTIVPLVQVGPKLNDPLLANAPAARELMANGLPDTRQILTLTERPLEWFRPFIVSPSTPPNVLAGMRAALTETMADPELLRDAAQLKFDIDHIPGERLQQLVDEYMQTPKELTRSHRFDGEGGNTELALGSECGTYSALTPCDITRGTAEYNPHSKRVARYFISTASANSRSTSTRASTD